MVAVFGRRLAVVALLALPAAAAAQDPRAFPVVGDLLSRQDGGGPPGDGISSQPTVSDDGRIVAYRSEAPNLGASEPRPALLVHDRSTSRTRVLVRAVEDGDIDDDDLFDPQLSADGRVLAFVGEPDELSPDDSDANEYIGFQFRDVFVADVRTGRTELVSRRSAARGGGAADGPSDAPAISADGRTVAFVSVADRLVPGTPREGIFAFVRDRRARRTERLPDRIRGLGGRATRTTGASVSGDGRVVAYAAERSRGGVTDVAIVRHDRRSRRTQVLTRYSTADLDDLDLSTSISDDGRRVGYATQRGSRRRPAADDDDNVNLARVFDARTGRSRTLSTRGGRTIEGREVVLSPDGRRAAFRSEEGDVNRLWLRRLDRRSAAPVAQGGIDPAFARAGGLAAVSESDGELTSQIYLRRLR